MNFIRKRARFIIIILFSSAVLIFTFMNTDFAISHAGRVGFVFNLLKILSGGYLIYGIVQCFRVK
ncbi:hypothetical protein RD055328_13900 [Companilactobacillus sp. RD055328]|uniref:hypothetical protein n=1 Tax=Companilactobacillus sp. RD055328 TaxID=2916634 RepID=UPI001FC7E3C3|nr:hypothetical protein [Companilactobacillus sp. RD055328]GKQ43467.1 hypothetical protein RD055328_13900 [Companilactobacillus sp. RD055328]